MKLLNLYFCAFVGKESVFSLLQVIWKVLNILIVLSCNLCCMSWSTVR